MYWFGEIKHNEDKTWLEDSAWESLSLKKRALAQTSLEDIISVLDSFSKIWTASSPFYSEVLEKLQKDSGFTLEETASTLALLPGILGRESLERRVRAEFQLPQVLDGFVKLSGGDAQVKASPLGILLHVTAGNVFLSSIDSLIMGLITKNISILKVSSQNTFFPEFFAQKLKEHDSRKILSDKFAILHWRGGDHEVERVVKNKVNAIIAWGGEEMIESYRSSLGPQVKFLDFGPKISLQVLTLEGVKNKEWSMIAQKIFDDVSPWNQSACASPQNLYVQNGIDQEKLLFALDETFKAAIKRAPISTDEATEILKEKYRALYSFLMEGGKLAEGSDYLLHVEKDKFIRPSPLNRSLIIKTFDDVEDLYIHLEPFSYYLQSCSYLWSGQENDEYLNALSLSGLKRFAPLGTITWGMEGAPHDGRLVLRELVHFIGNERRVVNYGEDFPVLSDSQKLKEFFETSTHPEGYIFSSGGTTGEPKFVHFSYQEFDYVTDMLALNLKAQGITRGMTVANLFVAGNLWSSFMAVDKALEKIGAIQLPIGGLCQVENIGMYLKKFKPQVVMGIPSLLVSYAEHFAQLGEKIHISKVFYAGEALSEVRREYLKDVWGTESFGSAGYASVDAGVIGYQCDHCGPGEHHLFSNLIQLDIIDDEAVVTSLYRDSMPVVHYKTGDKAEWIANCDCGRTDRRFKLLGRIDNVVQIWSCRLNLDDVEKTFQELQSDVKTYQLMITESREANLTREKLNLKYESPSVLDHDELTELLYHNSRDVKDTLTLDNFRKDLEIEHVGPGEIIRNPRTGKISLVKDLRR